MGADDRAGSQFSLLQVLCLGLLAAMGLLAGCSSTEPLEEPAPLPEHTGEVVLETLWYEQISDGTDDQLLFFVPALEGGAVYAIDADGDLYALEQATGEEIWERDLDESILGGVGSDGSRLYVTTRKGELLALNRDNGNEIWRVALPAEVVHPPSSNGELVVVQTIDGKVLGFAASSGKKAWQYDSPVPVLSFRGTGTPYIDSERVLAGLANGVLVALDVETGGPLWQYRLAVPEGRTELERLVDVDARPLVEGQEVYIVAYQGKLAALDLETGRELWTKEASSLVSPGLDSAQYYVAEADGRVRAFDRYTRIETWSNDGLKWRRLTAPVPAGDVVLVGDFEGYLHLLDPGTGQFVGQAYVDGDGLRTAARVHQGRIFILGNGGELVAYKVPKR